VELDSDWNEQAAIQAHLLRTLTLDLIGAAGGPAAQCGFGLADAAEAGVEPEVGDFLIGAGRYYVDGILVENDAPLAYTAQPHLPATQRLKSGLSYIAYLDVWDRHVTALEDDRLREVALGGPDTCTRVQTVWQVRTMEANAAPQPQDTDALKQQLEAAQEELATIRTQMEQTQDRAERAKLQRAATKLEKTIAALEERLANAGEEAENTDDPCNALLAELRGWTSGTMSARVEPVEPSDSPCVLPPDARYRGLENQLYRVEIHRGGTIGDAQPPTFKWSRENGSVAAPWLGIKGNEIQLSAPRGFSAGEWIEITDDADDLLARPGALARISRVEGDRLTIEGNAPNAPTGAHPKVRRWDQRATSEVTLDNGTVPIVAGDEGQGGWIEIEHGIEVRFSAGSYRTGDYWLIPARVATGDIEWPQQDGTPLPQSPRGIGHHYAPLFLFDATGESPYVSLTRDCRNQFQPMQPLVPPD
jgi:hypothetical protein